MLDIAIDPKTGEVVAARNAEKGYEYECKWCRTKLHVYEHRYFVRWKNQPEHSEPKCIAKAAKAPEDVIRKLERTRKDDFFNFIATRRDPLDEKGPKKPIEPPEDFGPETPPSDDPSTAYVAFEKIKEIATYCPEFSEILESMQENGVDGFDLGELCADEADMLSEEIDSLAYKLRESSRSFFSSKELEVIKSVVEKKIAEKLRRERPVRTLKQFDELGLIYYPGNTKFADCQLKDLFLSFDRKEYRRFFENHYKKIEKRILYCNIKAGDLARAVDEKHPPSLKFSMYWLDPEKTSVTLYVNFVDRNGHSAKEQYDYFVRTQLEQRETDKGATCLVPCRAPQDQIKDNRFNALVYGEWQNERLYDKVKDEKHYITLRTDYFNARQIRFIKGYE